MELLEQFSYSAGAKLQEESAGGKALASPASGSESHSGCSK